MHSLSRAPLRVLLLSASALVWRGALPADEFAVLTKLPTGPGVLYFPTVQTCGAEESQWTGIPDPGGTRLSNPAPALRVLPKPISTDIE
ncbi:DUF1775 domain-containing protein [Phenylobacterium sp.]|uniref:DUF1775 domain-containing protein n=1 Tax=Phenylobacterium sp. TaxID=1871053 RepID=UPI00286D7EAD|nr:DUF1775 domain-containing protein [Phenylobacterium sp.]